MRILGENSPPNAANIFDATISDDSLVLLLLLLLLC